jgi:hypothetical protein
MLDVPPQRAATWRAPREPAHESLEVLTRRRVAAVLAEATAEVLREPREARAHLSGDAAIDQTIIARAAQCASDLAVSPAQTADQRRPRADYDKQGRLVSFRSAGPTGLTNIGYDLNGKIVKCERPRLDA